jgi:hypothetical protein
MRMFPGRMRLSREVAWDEECAWGPGPVEEAQGQLPHRLLSRGKGRAVAMEVVDGPAFSTEFLLL